MARGSVIARPSWDRQLCLVDEWVDDLQYAMPWVSKKDIAVQAGGAIGIWPGALSLEFRLVYTFEPEAENFGCLVRNLEKCPNVIATRAALGAQRGFCEMRLEDKEHDNAGAWHAVSSDSGIPVLALDELALPGCDFICLDVEGAELSVLQGAAETIARFRPVIMLEQKQLPQMKRNGQQVGEASEWLQERGYRITMGVHNDVILVPA